MRMIVFGLLVFLSSFQGIAVAKSPCCSWQDNSCPPSYEDSQSFQPQVCFTPNKNCQILILKILKEAKKSIHIQAYSFTDPEIGVILQEAFLKKVTIKILLDKSNRKDKRSLQHTLKPLGISIRYDHLPGIAHNKVIIVDEKILITGSYNFSKSAYSRNAENVLVVNNQPLATLYLQNWHKRWEKSRS